MNAFNENLFLNVDNATGLRSIDSYVYHSRHTFFRSRPVARFFLTARPTTPCYLLGPEEINLIINKHFKTKYKN